MPNKQDSNLSGLRYAKETTPRVLPGTPNWIQLEPNDYNGFGAQYNQVSRNPMNALRQRKKGALVGIDAGGGFNQDLTAGNTIDLLQGFFFAALREKVTSTPVNGTAIPFTSTTATTYVAAGGLTFSITTQGNLVKGSGFTNPGNNGLHLLTIATATTLTTTGNVVETPPATAKVETVGHQFGAGVAAITMSGSIVQLAATGIESLPLIVGEWMYVGGDAAAMQFATANVGFARIKSIATGVVQFDKVTGLNPVADAGAGKTIQIFYGNVLRNENTTALIIKNSYMLERTLGIGNAGALVQAEYLEGSFCNEWTVNVPQEDKVTCDWSFVSLAHSKANSTAGPKSGNRPTLFDFPAFDTAASTPRIRIGKVDPSTSVVTALYTYGTDLSVTVSNGVSVNKALGVLGGVDVSVGNFEVNGSMTVYFQDVDQLDSIRLLQDTTLDFAVVETNTGYMVDIPLCTLGDGRNDLQQNQAVMAKLDIMAVQNGSAYTLLVNHFPYLPTIAG